VCISHCVASHAINRPLIGLTGKGSPRVRVYHFTLKSSGVVGYKLGRQEVAIFRQTAANFRQRRIWVLKILLLSLKGPNSPWGIFSPTFCIFLEKNFRQEEHFRTGQNLGVDNCPSTPLPRRHCSKALIPCEKIRHFCNTIRASDLSVKD